MPRIPFPPVRAEEGELAFSIIPANLPASSTRPRIKRRSFIPRVAILGSLAAATTIIPISGPPTSAANAEEGIEYGASDVLDALMDVDPGQEAGTETGALAADPLVDVRTAVTASRSYSREAPSCSVRGVNGVTAAQTTRFVPELVMPLAAGSYQITSHYGNRSLWGRYSMHAGLDWAAPSGTPIHSIADGVVEYAGPGKAGRSNMLIIVRHNINGQIVRSWYVHMYSNGVYAYAGQEVKAGQVIGAVGSNGNSTGPHLHLEIHLDDNLTTTDPAAWLAANGALPLDQETRDCLQS